MRLRFTLTGLFVLAADQLTKLWIVRTLPQGHSVVVVHDVLRISHVRNAGAAFGLFQGATSFLVLSALIGVAVFTVVIMRRPPPLIGYAAALVAGGAFGNLADRMLRPWPFRGAVVDFIDFDFWPTFNVADIAISLGAAALIIAGIFEGQDHTEDDEPSEVQGDRG